MGISGNNGGGIDGDRNYQTEECIHGMGDRSWCTICSPVREHQEEQRKLKWVCEHRDDLTQFYAKYLNECYVCDCSVGEGDSVWGVKEKGRGWTLVCDECFTEAVLMG